MGDTPVRVGLIGYGLAGALIHAPLIEAAGGLRITAVATSRDLSGRRDGPRQAADATSLIAADDIDLVVVASPNDTHASYARLALEAGKHVVVDKPFALSSREADDLISLARGRGLIVTAFHNRRADGDFLAVAEAIRSGEVGEVLLFEGRWDRFRPAVAAGWRNSARDGGGVLWDLGPHLIDQALQLFGKPDGFSADVAVQRTGAQADDYFELTLRYGAMRCILSASSVAAAARPRFSVHGTKGSLLVHGIDPGEPALRAGMHPSDPRFQAQLPPIPATWVTAEGRRELTYPAGSWVGFYQQVRDAVVEGARPPVDPQDAREVIAMIEQAFARSAARS